MNNDLKRDGFSSRFGIIAAAAGSAIGLGNIWRFPYVLGESGGAAFLLTYLMFVFIIGIPVMMSELLIGRMGQKNIIGTFKKLAPGKPWFLTGIMGVGVAFMILSFYSVLGGWTLEYVYSSIERTLGIGHPGSFNQEYVQMKSSFVDSAGWVILFLVITAVIVLGGVKNGIEKYSKILMPMLLGIIILLDIRALTLPGASEGVAFLFKPDFSKLTSEVILKALGQAFFSLSIGMGVMATYGSYINKSEKLGTTAFSVSISDTLIALLAGIAIFPAAFAFGIKPDSGPDLVFITLPNIFNQLPAGAFLALLFFMLLAIAALTSSISLLEVVVAYFTEELKMKRKVATLVATFSMILLALLCTGYASVFTAFDYISSNIILPLGGILIVLFAGWYLGRNQVKAELEAGGHRFKLFPLFWFVIRFLAPIAIAIVFLNGLGLF
jgi:NSS family neurotransmitter:Na+ symporter